MKSRSAPVSHLVAPLKSAAQRFAYSALMLLSIAIMVIGAADGSLIEHIRTRTNDVLAPVLEAVTQPVTAVTDAVAHVRSLTELYHENERLKAENAALLQWQQVARRLDNENSGLRTLLNYQPEGSIWFITARVIGTSGGAFSRNRADQPRDARQRRQGPGGRRRHRPGRPRDRGRRPGRPGAADHRPQFAHPGR